MSDGSGGPKLSPQAWALREERFLRFEKLWQSQNCPSIFEFLEAEDQVDDDELLELIRIDIDQRRQGQAWLDVSKYLELFPSREIEDEPGLAFHVIEADARSRISAGLTPDFQRYALINPALADRVQALVDSLPTADSQSSQSVPKHLDRYEIRGELGSGAFATVYRAWDPKLRREVAIKLPHPNLMVAAESRERFLREARSIAKLNHQSILPIFEVHDASDMVFLVSELYSGRSLKDLLDEGGYELPELVSYFEQIAGALSYAHQNGVIHRDVKPANILISDQVGKPRAILADFGLARQIGSETLTGQGDLLGTPAFMSPEQARGEHAQLDGRSDVYSLGVVMYLAMSGKLPFEGPPGSVLTKLQSETPVQPRRLNLEAPKDLETICLKCLEKMPADRYTDASALAADLRHFLSGEPIQARPSTRAERVWKWALRYPALAMASLVTVTLAAFLIGLATQLIVTLQERDRATQAEAQVNQLLAGSYLDAARLAMQRGQFRRAVELLDRSGEHEGHQRAEILLLKAECQIILREFAQARAQLTDLDAEGLQSQHQGKAVIWQAELAMLDSFAEAIELYEEASTYDLVPADRAYVTAMLSVDSHEAAELLREAVRQDPFHHRARLMLANTLLALGQLDAGAFEITICQQLFPEDPTFHLMEGLVQAIGGELESANQSAPSQNLPQSLVDDWHDFYKLVSEVVEMMRKEKTLDASIGRSIVGLVDERSNSLKTIADSGWRLPPRIGIKFHQLLIALGESENEELHLVLGEIEQLLESHREGTLHIVRGELLIAEERIEEARDAFLKAREVGSLLGTHRDVASLGVIVTAMHLAVINRVDSPQNFETARKAIESLQPDTEYPPKYSSLFMKVALSQGDVALCERWLEVWRLQVEEGDQDFMRHEIEFTAMAQKTIMTLTLCDQFIEKFPDDPYGFDMKKRLLGGMNLAIENASQAGDHSPDSAGEVPPAETP